MGSPRRSSTAPLALDRAIHEPMRLGIVTALAGAASLTFVELKASLGATDGNLSVHARKLESAGYVVSVKSFEGRVPRTEFRLTHAGRKAFGAYLESNRGDRSCGTPRNGVRSRQGPGRLLDPQLTSVAVVSGFSRTQSPPKPGIHFC